MTNQPVESVREKLWEELIILRHNDAFTTVDLVAKILSIIKKEVVPEEQEISPLMPGRERKGWNLCRSEILKRLD